ALAIMRLLPDLGSVAAGTISLRGENLAGYAGAQMRRIRGNKISMIFQEPMTALNPTYTVGNQICEPLRLHQKLAPAAARERGIRILKSVGIPAAERRMDEYPHQLS